MINERDKPDFSNVQGGSTASEKKHPDFGNVNAGVTSTAEYVPTERIYTVVAGDSLSRIAKEFYGKASRWPKIFEANRDQLSNPDVIKPGQVLKIPLDQDDENAKNAKNAKSTD